MGGRYAWLGIAWVAACGPEPIVGGDGSSSDDASGGPTTSTSVATVADDSTGSDTYKLDAGAFECPRTDPQQLDLLVIVENTPAMAQIQTRFAGVATEIVRTLETGTDAQGNDVDLDVQLMFTTTDVGNPLCAAPPGYVPASGAPVATGCNQRIAQFGMQAEVCTTACPFDSVPGGDFIAFVGDQATNVLDVPPVDVDGDGELDSPAAQSAACLAPAGLVGCDYASPLEAMRRALDPAAPWNQGDRPFLRPDAALGIVIVEDGFDCSIADASVMSDPAFMEIDPQTGVEGPSQAICWNAGVACDGPDAQGVYASCAATAGALHPVATYADFLATQVGDPDCKHPFMIPMMGVPHVSAHNPAPPFEPIEGGVADLVYRDWIDGLFPMGDILPSEWAMGVAGPHKQFELGIGPGCTTDDPESGFVAQAVPDPRTIEVCQSLYYAPGDWQIPRCCIESVCDAEQTGALVCLNGMIFPIISDLFPD